MFFFIYFRIPTFERLRLVSTKIIQHTGLFEPQKELCSLLLTKEALIPWNMSTGDNGDNMTSKGQGRQLPIRVPDNR